MLNVDTVKIGFIGYGNMSGATSRGLIKSGIVDAKQIYASAKNYDKLCKNAAEDGINPCENSEILANECDIIFIGVKPYMVENVMSPIKDLVKDKVVVSLAANTYYEQLAEIMPGAHIVATAPNTPVSVCEGIFICETENNLEEEEKEFLQKLLESISLVLWMDKDHMGVGGVVAGCSPAFVSMFMEALGDAGCRHGLTRDVVYPMIAQMLVGTGKMALASGKHPGQLKDAVCSPGGTTIAGVEALEKNGFRFAVMDAIDQVENKIKGKI